MQLKDLVKPISEMSNDELLEHVRRIRQNRHIIRPAHKAHVERAEKKEARVREKKTANLFASLSEADKALLVAELMKDDQGGTAGTVDSDSPGADVSP